MMSLRQSKSKGSHRATNQRDNIKSSITLTLMLTLKICPSPSKKKGTHSYLYLYSLTPSFLLQELTHSLKDPVSLQNYKSTSCLSHAHVMPCLILTLNQDRHRKWKTRSSKQNQLPASLPAPNVLYFSIENMEQDHAEPRILLTTGEST
jgi:hypothetical protein